MYISVLLSLMPGVNVFTIFIFILIHILTLDFILLGEWIFCFEDIHIETSNNSNGYSEYGSGVSLHRMSSDLMCDFVDKRLKLRRKWQECDVSWRYDGEIFRKMTAMIWKDFQEICKSFVKVSHHQFFRPSSLLKLKLEHSSCSGF